MFFPLETSTLVAIHKIALRGCAEVFKLPHVVEAFMASPGHRALILHASTTYFVCAVAYNKYGAMFCEQLAYGDKGMPVDPPSKQPGFSPPALPVVVHWDVNNEYSSSNDTSNLVGNTYRLPLEPYRDGFTFDGWYTSPTDGTKVSEETIVTNNADHTLYAHWTAKMVTVTYNAYPGSVSPTSTIKTAWDYYGALPTPTRSNYTFDGWYTEATGGTQVTSTTTVTNGEDHTLYAHWTAATVTVIYDATGGSVSPTSAIKTVGDYYGTLPTPTRLNYAFDGWYTEAIGGTQIGSAATFVTNSSNHTIYAHWTTVQPQTVTVTYNPAGGSVSPGSEAKTLGSAYGTLPTPSRNGYVFDGWFTATSAGTKVSPTTTVTNSSDHTLYAHWTTDPSQNATVTFYSRGGQGVVQMGTIPLGTALGTLPSTTRSGYIFDGWFTLSVGGRPINSTEIVTRNVIFYAHWIEDRVIKDSASVSAGFELTIKWMMDKQITSVNPYNPQGAVTREQMAAFMYALAGRPALGPTAEAVVIKDISQVSAGFETPIKWMIDQGITSINPYNPQGVVTREQMAAFMYSLASRPALSSDAQAIAIKDANQMSAGFETPIKWMIDRKITSVNPYNPQGKVTREQMAAFMYSFNRNVYQQL
jgi:uncharacterized repeat protein (TIGR02543 family)